MSGLHNLKPNRVVKAFERAGVEFQHKSPLSFKLNPQLESKEFPS
jgi:hypothetical protein